MSPIQQMLLGVGAVATKTYVDDVFSTYLYAGNDSNIAVNNGIDISTEGGLVWIKNRDTTGYGHFLFDTERGTTKAICSNLTNAEFTETKGVHTFSTNGFTIGGSGGDAAFNSSGTDYASFTFRKSPGFFDCVVYQGTGSKRTVPHNLGCRPGMIVIKRTDQSGDNWDVWHESLGESQISNDWNYLQLNSTTFASNTSRFGVYGTDDPTSTTFTVKNQSGVNASGGTYVAYLFAGGESTAATARSVEFDSSSEYLEIADSSDFDMGTTFTIEAWVRPDYSNNKNYNNFFVHGNFVMSVRDNGNFEVEGFSGDCRSSNGSVPEGQWTHVAVVVDSGTANLYVNGVRNQSHERTGINLNNSGDVYIAKSSFSTIYPYTGEISNLRYVKGTAVYTSSFRPPYEPLTNITNTKLLCCNDSSVTGSTVTPNTITANGSPTASSDSPFDDPEGFVFGDAGDQNVIKCGSFVGNGSSPTSVTGPNVFVGFEPQWLMIKSASATGAWTMFDSMRGVVTGGGDQYLFAQSTFGSTGTAEYIEFNSTGFRLVGGGGNWNNTDDYIYIAIRRPDGYVGKPPELGTDVFNVIAADTTPPAFNANFAVDYAIYKTKNQSADWFTTSRLTAHKNLKTNATDGEVDGGGSSWFAYNDGFSASNGFSSNRIGWLWKRHAGFDVVAYEGDEVSTNDRVIRHSLGKIPEMIWVKNRTINYSWDVYHKGMNGGTNPWNYGMHLNETGAESADSSVWNNTAPTSLGFTVGSSHTVNRDGSNFIAMLFASVDGISKVGSFVGSDSDQTITTGFQPRFVIIKQTSGSFASWYVLDTTRGWGSGNDNWLLLNENQAQSSNNVGAPTSTGFTVTGNFGGINDAGFSCIYYAHA